ncbi:MAG: ComEC/Rec2 family competence protein [Kiritimatiellae bacterium]|nr:ComEC/Rec2 family competence protein [Kiritimatiellia bacterium]
MRLIFKSALRSAIEMVAGLHRRQPMLALSALLLAGILCGYQIGFWPLPAAVALCCVAGAFFLQQSPLRNAFVFLMFFCLGWLVSARDLDGRRHEARLLADAPKQQYLCRVGPSVIVAPLRGKSARFSFSAINFRSADGAVKCRHMPVTIDWYGAREAELGLAPRPGEEWSFTGKCKVRKGRNGLMEITVSTGVERSAKVAESDSGTWQARIAAARRQAAKRLTIGIEDWGAVPALVQAMLLGSRSEMSREMRRVFADSGTIHVFAISGLHIAFVTGLLVMAVRLLGVQRHYWGVYVAPLLIFYTVAVGARPSAVRACVMAILYLSAALLGRRPNVLAALTVTALAVHVFRPWLVFEAGNILSFAVMGGLVVFCGPFMERLHKLCGIARFEQDARLLAAAGETHRASRLRARKSVVLFFVDSFAVSLAAWISSVPLTAFYFGRFTPGGLLANLVVAPCAFLIVMSGFLGLLSSFVSVEVASCFNNAAGFFTWMMMRTAEVTARFPGGNFHVRKWEAWMVGLWFAGLALLAMRLHTAGRDSGLNWVKDAAEGGT